MNDRATLPPPAGAISARPPSPWRRRLLGQVLGERPGPTLVLVAGVHGNEPSGVHAVARVLSALEGKEASLAGEVVALAGNLEALAQGVRYVERDLNRSWTAERVSRLSERLSGLEGGSPGPEDREQAGLLAELDAAFARARGPVFVLDLHSTSGGGAPFAVLDDTLPNRAFAARLPVPIVLGLEEVLEGTLLAYLSDRGHVTVAFEAGQHTSPRAVDHAEGAVWIALEAAGLLAPGDLAPPAHLTALLAAAGAGLPRFVEARHRQALAPGDGFQMEPGFENFQVVEEGQLLARDRRGEIRSPSAGLLLMPLYQPQGEEGFFLVRGFNPWWLKLSTALRRLRADRLVHWLPGVERHPEVPAAYFVDRRVARWYALEIFHLLGFRRIHQVDDRLVVSRRPQDLAVRRRRRLAA